MTSTHVDHPAEEMRQLHQSFVDSIPGLIATFTPSGELNVVNAQLVEYHKPVAYYLWVAGDAAEVSSLPHSIQTLVF